MFAGRNRRARQRYVLRYGLVTCRTLCVAVPSQVSRARFDNAPHVWRSIVRGSRFVRLSSSELRALERIVRVHVKSRDHRHGCQTCGRDALAQAFSLFRCEHYRTREATATEIIALGSMASADDCKPVRYSACDRGSVRQSVVRVNSGVCGVCCMCDTAIVYHFCVRACVRRRGTRCLEALRRFAGSARTVGSWRQPSRGRIGARGVWAPGGITLPITFARADIATMNIISKYRCRHRVAPSQLRRRKSIDSHRSSQPSRRSRARLAAVESASARSSHTSPPTQRRRNPNVSGCA